MKKIEDYLHLYLGCDCLFNPYSDKKEHEWVAKMTTQDLHRFGGRLDWMKPILRQLSDMTEDEKTWFVKDGGDLDPRFIINEFHFEEKHDRMKQYYFDALTVADEDMDKRLGPGWYFMAIQYLLKQGFDLFGLIEAGLAIDKTKL